MNRTAILAIVFVAVLVAVVFFGMDAAQAATDKPLPKPDPLVPPAPPPSPITFAELPPEKWKQATVNTSTGPVTLVQKHDTSTLRPLVQTPVVPAGVTAVPLRTDLRSLLR